MLDPGAKETEPFMGTVLYMFNYKEAPMAQVHYFSRGVDTVLGETGDLAELFRPITCDDEPPLSYVGKASVKILQSGVNLEGSTPHTWERESDPSFFCSLWYDF